ncbi:MAG: PrsW family intramembrane metalloprotease [Bacteroidota bacterium]
MLSWGLLCLAIAPGIAISLYIYHKDKYDKEPKRLLIAAFLLGIVSTVPTIFISRWFANLSGLYENHSSLVLLLTYSVLGIGLVEELSKFIFVRIFYKHPAFDHPFDGVVYSVMVSMGFATLENIQYVIEGGMQTALLRMFISVPAHAAFAVVMGFYMGKAKFSQHSLPFLLLAIIIPSIYHGLFDFFLIQKFHILLSVGAAVTFLHIIRLSRRIIRNH